MNAPARSRAATAALVASFAAGTLIACGDEATGPEGPPVAPPCTAADSLCMERLPLGAARYLPVYRTHSLTTGDGAVEHAVIVVHGTDRNADTYFVTMVEALRAAGALARTIVVSPDFQMKEDGPTPDEPWWSNEGWKRGDLSASDSPLERISSFATVDTLLRVLADRSRFPRLRNIVVTGHSAGGQFTHRYAGASPFAEALGGLPVRFVVANPSTYFWLGPERPSEDGFARPDTTACPEWNDWPYGLADRNTYARGVGDDGIRVPLATRDVRILVGDADTLTANLDMSCPANLQGRRRYDRGRSLVRFMDVYFPGHGHRESVVPGMGHSSQSMYGSPAGKAALTVW